MANWSDGQRPDSAPPHTGYGPPPQPGFQPYPGQPHPGRYQAAPVPPPSPRRQGWVTGLIASLAVLAVLVVAIVVVFALRDRGDADNGATTPTGSPTTAPTAAPTAGAGSPAAGNAAAPVDTCLIGNWRQTSYVASVDLGAGLGTVKVGGSGRTWRIRADGTADEDFTGTKYRGTTADGRAVELTFTGQHTWALKTAEQKILFTSTGSTVQLTLTVKGVAAPPTKIEPHNNPQPYTCASSFWSTTSLTDSEASSRYDRVA